MQEAITPDSIPIPPVHMTWGDVKQLVAENAIAKEQLVRIARERQLQECLAQLAEAKALLKTDEAQG